MKNFIIISLIFLLFSCSVTKKIDQDHNNTSYLIKKIKSKHDWYIFYAVRNDTTYKIVSKKETVQNKASIKIVVGKYYNLILHSNIPVIDGVKMQPINYLDVECLHFDTNTIICIEPKKGIYDLYSAENIKGLYYIEKNP